MPKDSVRNAGTVRGGQEIRMRKMNGWLLIGFIGIAVFGSHFGIQYGRALWSSSAKWWTPKSMALPLDSTRQDFNLFINGIMLQDYIERGSLYTRDTQGELLRVTPDDIEVRLNNWNKVRFSWLHFAVFFAFVLGISLMCFIVGVIQLFMRTEKTRNKPRTDGV